MTAYGPADTKDLERSIKSWREYYNMLTLRGIKLMAWGSQEHGEMVKKNFTNENIGEEKLHHFTNETKGGM